MRDKPYLCPVCGKYEFPFRGSFYTCHVCGWIDDLVQSNHPDEDHCANFMSLNEARKVYAEGREIE